MKPAPFEYRRPATVAGALADLATAEGARVLAGGQSLVPLLNLRLASPPVVVDINRVEGLDAVVERDGRVHIGATARQSAVLSSELVRNRLPLVAAADFFLGSFAVAVPAGGLVTGVAFPVAAPGTGAGFYEVTRKAKDFALIAAAAQLTVSGGAVTDARVAVTGLTHRPVRMTAVESALVGDPPTAEAIRDAARLAGGEVLAEVNTRSPAAYRRRVLPVVVARALKQAAQEVAP